MKYLKINRILAILLTFILLLSMFPTGVYAASGAKDLDGHWAAMAIETCHSYDIMNGYNSYYRPDEDITRAEFATMINRAFGYDALNVPELTGYTDVPADKWYANDMATAISLGIIAGYGNGIAAPDDKVTREQAAVILAKVLRLTPDNNVATRFADMSDVSSWAVEAVLTMEQSGYITGHNNEFMPKMYITRGEAAQLLHNVFGVIIDGDFDAQGAAYQNVTIRKPGVILKNVIIKGDLFITEGVGDGEIWLDSIQIDGRMLVTGGGENSIHVANITVGDNVVVDKPSMAGDEPVRFRAVQTSDSTVIFQGTAREVIITEDIIIIIDMDGEKTVFNMFKPEDGTTKPSVIIADDAVVEKVTAFVPMEITGSGEVGKVEVHADGVTVDAGVNVFPNNIEAASGVTVTVGAESIIGTGIENPTQKPESAPIPGVNATPTTTPDPIPELTPSPTPAPTPTPTPDPTPTTVPVPTHVPTLRPQTDGGTIGGDSGSESGGGTHTSKTPQDAFTLNGGSPKTVTYGDANFTIAAVGGSGNGAITYVSNKTTVATVNAATGEVTIIGAGTATITATKAEDMTYAEAAASYTLTVKPKTLTIQNATHTKVYDGTISAIGVTATVNNGDILASDIANVSVNVVTAAYTSANAGTTTIDISNITLQGPAADNYTVAAANGVSVAGITPKPITIDVSSLSGVTLMPLPSKKSTTMTVTLGGFISDADASAASFGANFNNLSYTASASVNNKTKTYTLTLTLPQNQFYQNGSATIIIDKSGTLSSNYTYTGGQKTTTVNVIDGFYHLIPLTNANIAEFNTFANSGVYGGGLHYKLMEDITLAAPVSPVASNWIPIDYFSGSFDGQGYSIKNLTINRSDSNTGMFSTLSGYGSIENLTLENVSINGGDNTGGIVGSISSSWNAAIRKCAVIGTVTGADSVGGIAGTNNGGIIENCYTVGNISGIQLIGGIVGGNYYNTVKNCYATGTVYGSDWAAGGIAGLNYGTVKNCVALNQSVIMDGPYRDAGRIIGFDYIVTLAGNYAWSGMTVMYDSDEKDPLDKGTEQVDGADITAVEWDNASWWTNPSNWDTAAWDTNVWNITTGSLPTLKNVSGTQNPIAPAAVPYSFALLLTATVGVNGGILSDGGTIGEFVIGETVTVTAMPDEGWTFAYWMDENGEIVSYDAAYSFAVTADVKLTAVCIKDEILPVEYGDEPDVQANDPSEETDPIIVPDDNGE